MTNVIWKVSLSFLIVQRLARTGRNACATMLNLPHFFMNNDRDQRSESNPANLARPIRRRRLVLWVLGLTVLVLLSIIVSQQLWLWTVLPPDTASDTLLLYALSTLNFVAFVVFSFIFVRNLLKLRRERRELQLGSKIKT